MMAPFLLLNGVLVHLTPQGVRFVLLSPLVSLTLSEGWRGREVLGGLPAPLAEVVALYLDATGRAEP